MHVCFFDIDGTLVETGGAGQTAFALTLAKDFGIAEMSTDVAFAGRSDRAIAMDLFAAHGVETSPEQWQIFCRGYLDHLDEALPTHKGQILPGVVELIERLASRGDVCIGLLTGNVREAARRKLTYYQLWDRFAFGGFGDTHTERNDIAADALKAARAYLQLNAKPGKNGSPDGRFVVIGDTVNDIVCGRSIGARCVAVPTGHTSAETLRQHEPDVLVPTLQSADLILNLFD
jgi:phosphoglycolate phosphatase-like HAD superfamily hydrolase